MSIISKKLSWPIGIIIFLVFGISYLFFYNQQSRQQESGISSNESLASSLFETKEWIGLVGYPGSISLRTTFDNSENLLLKHNNKDVVYRYDLAAKQLQLVNAETWANATGEIINCNSQEVGKELWRIQIDGETNKLLMDNSEVKNIKGSVHLRYQFSPRGDKLAVLSASGKKSSSLMPFLGEGGASGTHYNQVFSFPELVSIGSAVELPFTTEKVNFSSCWSSDDKFVVYSNALDSKLVIVDAK